MYKITVHHKANLVSTYYMDSVESAILLFQTWYAKRNEVLSWLEDEDEFLISSAQAHASITPYAII